MTPIKDFNDLINHLRLLPQRKRVALVCPDDSHTDYVITRVIAEGLADLLLVAGGKCSSVAVELAKDYPDRVALVVEPNADSAARRAVAAVRAGNADVLMKGTINTDNLLRAVLDKECGLLEKGCVLSHISVAQIPGYGRLILFSDAAVIPRPTEEQFEAIVGYGTDVCRRIGIEQPKVALIHCTEKVNEKFPHTLYYDSLKRKAAAGLWGDILMGGPMDVKTACDAESGELKGIVTPVTGCADMMVFPNIESGNVFYKAVSLFARAEMAGMLCGTVAPVVVASRADTGDSKLYSLALACL
ncbi:phosphate acyltransferase [Xylanibacter muris]|uniref:Phosphate butyryltransferase n=1 Tax=Xylanibacter muris TaxID=2736290 RepID=A0ABX2AJN4_9BACT|nr:phosphate acyltransferase [Xylanibacter muris]NPD91018.1 phosphate butyryltransferase [Xylanibacter muris]